MRMKSAPSGHRFAIGDRVFLRPRKHTWFDDEFVITGLSSHNRWPHYELLAPDGTVWHASQLELTTRSFALR